MLGLGRKALPVVFLLAVGIGLPYGIFHAYIRTVSGSYFQLENVEVRGLDLTGLQIAEEYRAAIEQKQIAEQQLLRAQTEVKIAEQEALRYDTLNRSLDDQVLYKLFLDKWDGQTEVVPALPGSNASTPPVIVGRRS